MGRNFDRFAVGMIRFGLLSPPI